MSIKRIDRKCLWLGAATAVVLLASIQPARAVNILYFVDLAVGTDRMAQALADPAITGSHTVTTATSIPNFTTQLTTGNFPLAIFFQQNSVGADYDAAFAALATHIGGGGRAIADDWSQNNTHAAAFQTQFAAGPNQNQFTVTDPGLAALIGNPVDLINPGWSIFATAEGTLAGGVVVATFPNAAAAIVIGNSRRTIFNGFLNDTFDSGPEGVQLYINEINEVLVPEPGSLALLAIGVGALGLVIRRRRAA